MDNNLLHSKNYCQKIIETTPTAQVPICIYIHICRQSSQTLIGVLLAFSSLHLALCVLIRLCILSCLDHNQFCPFSTDWYCHYLYVVLYQWLCLD